MGQQAPALKHKRSKMASMPGIHRAEGDEGETDTAPQWLQEAVEAHNRVRG